MSGLLDGGQRSGERLIAPAQRKSLPKPVSMRTYEFRAIPPHAESEGMIVNDDYIDYRGLTFDGAIKNGCAARAQCRRTACMVAVEGWMPETNTRGCHLVERGLQSRRTPPGRRSQGRASSLLWAKATNACDISARAHDGIRLMDIQNPPHAWRPISSPETSNCRRLLLGPIGGPRSRSDSK
jgi:hypothetical protein